MTPFPPDPAIPPARRIRWRNAVLWAVLVLFLPAAFLGAVMHANEYESWGGGGVDCDGPMLLTFAVPAAIVYSLGALVFIRRAVRGRRWGAGLAALACIALVAALVNNIGNARRELREPSLPGDVHGLMADRCQRRVCWKTCGDLIS